METNINKCIKKEKIFLCKKVKRSKSNKNFKKKKKLEFHFMFLNLGIVYFN